MNFRQNMRLSSYFHRIQFYFLLAIGDTFCVLYILHILRSVGLFYKTKNYRRTLAVFYQSISIIGFETFIFYRSEIIPFYFYVVLFVEERYKEIAFLLKCRKTQKVLHKSLPKTQKLSFVFLWLRLFYLVTTQL